MMDRDLFSQSFGYIGHTTYTLRYLENTKDLSCKWPRTNVFHQCSCEELFNSILDQKVGIDRSFAYREDCDRLKVILRKFVKSHGKTNYKELLQKCKNKDNNGQLQSTPRHIIKEYIHRIIFNVIPLQLFGTKFNAIQFERNFRRIFFLGKFQVFSLNMVLQSIQFKRIAFLRSIDNYNDKANLFAKLFIWLVRVYILAALKCVFYVTELNYSNKYVFYEKRVWKKIHQCRIKKIKKEVLGTHKNCIIRGIVQSKHLYTVKLLPKYRGSRPIFVKLEKNKDWKVKCRLARKMTEILFSRIAGDYFRNVNSSWRVFHEKWLFLHEKWKSNQQPFVYFVRTDFIDAFASVDLTKLMQIISKLREKNENASDIRFQYQGWLKNIPLKSAYKILDDYMNKFYFNHRDKVYRLTRGLCQGGPLSCLLFDLYLGEWEKLYLTECVDDENGFFIRNCDDCLYCTMDRAKASSYLRHVEDGFPDFNLFVNCRKTETNVRNESLVTVTFCNYTLDVQFFQIYKRYELYRNCGVFHSSRFSSLESPGKTILKRMGRPCMSKLSKVFLDSTYNTIYTTLYNVFLVARISVAYCLAHMERLFTHFNEAFIMKCIVVCSRRIGTVANDSHKFDVDINRNMIAWMVIKAFIVQMDVLKSKNFTRIMLSADGFLKNLFEQMDVKEQEIILEFVRTYPPEPLKSLM